MRSGFCMHRIENAHVFQTLYLMRIAYSTQRDYFLSVQVSYQTTLFSAEYDRFSAGCFCNRLNDDR